MKILLITGTLFPILGNNANILGKIIPYLKKDDEVHFFSMSYRSTELPDTLFEIPVHWVTDSKNDFMRKFIFPAISKTVDRNGYSDALNVMIMLRELKNVRKIFDFDAIISTWEPFSAALVSTKIKCSKRLLYLMDPPASVIAGKDTLYRKRNLENILRKYNTIFTTPFIYHALINNGYNKYSNKIQTVGFPMIGQIQKDRFQILSDPNRITLLFCGSIYKDIRSPQFFLDIVSLLDARFRVCFIGNGCENLQSLYSFHTCAEIITLPQQPYQTIIAEMLNADILINIGNSLPIHMPSKILEYINTGKPIINFYKREDCPTRYYTKRYPLCLDIFEGEKNIAGVAERVIDFCKTNKNRIVLRDDILEEFHDCTIEFIADRFLNALGETYE